MPNDLFCPLENNCEVYKDYKNAVSPSGRYKSIIRGAVDGYSCRALYRVNGLESNKEKKGECALIKLLNNSDALLKLGGKGSL